MKNLKLFAFVLICSLFFVPELSAQNDCDCDPFEEPTLCVNMKGFTIPITECYYACCLADGVELEIVDCEDIDLGNNDWDDSNPWGGDNPFEFELVCIEITVDGETSIIVVTENVVEETLEALDTEGINASVTECEGLPDLGDPTDGEDGDGQLDDCGCDPEAEPDFCVNLGGFPFPVTQCYYDCCLADGVELEIVDCEDFDWGDSDPWGGDPGDFELVCIEITIDGETSVIAVTENAVDETLASLEDQGFTATITDCEDLPDLGDPSGGQTDDCGCDPEAEPDFCVNLGGFPFPVTQCYYECCLADGVELEIVDCEDFDWEDDNPWGDNDPWGGDPGDFELVCIEITIDGESSIIAVTENAVDETLASLEDEGFTAIITDCEDLPDLGDPSGGQSDDCGCDPFAEPDFCVNFDGFPMPVTQCYYDCCLADGVELEIVDCEDFDWNDNDPWGGDTEDFELVCIEITAEGETSIIAVSESTVEEFIEAIEAEGYTATITDCEDLPDLGDPSEGETDDCGCDTEAEPDFCVNLGGFPFPVTQCYYDCCLADGVELEIVDCEDFDWNDNDPWGGDAGDFDLVCIEITAEGETSVIEISEGIVGEFIASIEEEGYTANIVDCDEEDGFGIGNNSYEGDLEFVSVYPNPLPQGTEKVKLSFENDLEQDLRVEVYNIQGALVLNSRTLAFQGFNSIEIDLSSVENGVYILNIVNEDGTNLVQEKIIK